MKSLLLNNTRNSLWNKKTTLFEAHKFAISVDLFPSMAICRLDTNSPRFALVDKYSGNNSKSVNMISPGEWTT